MKTCFKCNQTKELSEFYNHPKTADGHLGKCKECTKKDALEHRNKNIEKIRAYDRERGKLPHRLEANRLRCLDLPLEKKLKLNEYKRNWYSKHKKQRHLIDIAWKKNNINKYIAHNIVNNAIKYKKIKKPSLCEECGAQVELQGHHEDYNKPLDVKWLCSSCHGKKHRKIV